MGVPKKNFLYQRSEIVVWKYMMGNYETINYELQISYVHLFAINLSGFIKMYLMLAYYCSCLTASCETN